MSELKLPAYGGQAVIEGVMMRGKQYVAIALRNPEEPARQNPIPARFSDALGCINPRYESLDHLGEHPNR